MSDVDPKHDPRSFPEIPPRIAFSTGPIISRPQDELIDHVANVLLFLLSNSTPSSLSLKDIFMMLERKVLFKALRIFNGHQAHTAEFLQVLTTTLSAKIRRYQIDNARVKAAPSNGFATNQANEPSTQVPREGG